MHTLSPRTLSALAFDRGEEYDPGQPLPASLLDDLTSIEHAARVIGEDGSYERARQRRREQRQANGIPAWFSAEDLIAAPWEHGERRFV